jgi:DNA polymerase-3 subunit epsilon
MQFTAIDVETANADMASICQIGTACFVHGVVTDEWKTYVDPQDHFDAINVSIHGITAKTVKGSPTFGALVSKLQAALNGNIVVSHTAFDKIAIYQAAMKYDTHPPSCTWLDSAWVVRRTWDNFSRRGYGLENVCKFIGYDFKPHDALEDAKAAGNIMLAAIKESGLDLNAWLATVRQPIYPDYWHKEHQPIYPNHHYKEYKEYNERVAREGNPDGELFGEVLVFTGALSLSRREAADAAASMGCEVDAVVTKRTTILVVGDQDVKMLAGHEKSSKHRKAEELVRKGQSIRILRESDFRTLLRLAP